MIKKQGLQYVVGHIFHKFYKKFRRVIPIQELLSILKSAKIEENNTQRLVNVKDRRGLWKVNNNTQKIFEICEIEFERNKNKIMKNHKKILMTCVKIYLKMHWYNPIIITFTVLLVVKFPKKMLLIYWKNLCCYIYVFEANHLPKMLKKLIK